MNYRMIFYILGMIGITLAGFLLIPSIFALCFGEMNSFYAFIITVAIVGVIGCCLAFIKKPKNKEIKARSGFIIVALGWLFMALFGAIPFCISKSIPNYIDCVFETVSGFTTTGATLVTDVEAMPKSMLLWRSLTHWMGGMGVLAFVVAFLPKNAPDVIYVMKAETPGPQFGKLVSKLRFSSRLLYIIYIVLTLSEAILLKIGGMSFFDSIIHALSTAGTGGFSSRNLSIGAYNSVYIEIVVTVFMLLFSLNFNVFYLLCIGQFSKAIRNEEVRTFFLIYAVATVGIALSETYNKVGAYNNFWTSLRYSSFQTASIVSTTGFATADFSTWTTLSQAILVMLMFLGGCTGSTAGGLKVYRVIVMYKYSMRNIKKSIEPRRVLPIKIDKQVVPLSVIEGIVGYCGVFVLLLLSSFVLICVSNPSNDIVTNLTSVITCLNNVGPGVGTIIGSYGNYSSFSWFSKIILSLDMLIGRLEILPIVLLFYKKSYSN